MKAPAHASLGGAGVLLLGAQAEALAPRLALSGYRPLRVAPGTAERLLAAPLETDHGADVTLADRTPVDVTLAERTLAAEASGFETRGTRERDAGPEEPAALILSAGLESRLPELRRRWGQRPMLLGIERDDVAGRARCLSCGASDIWFTDLGASDLLGRLRLHLSRPERESAPPRTMPPATMPAAAAAPPAAAPSSGSADLRLDPSRRRAWWGERPIPLSAREFALLELLLAQRGRVVSRERILESVWNGERPAASNVIEVYVRYLRRKLEEGGERRLIHTVRGQGYRLGDPLPTSS